MYISNEQMDEFGRPIREKFIDNMMQYLKDEVPDSIKHMDDEQLKTYCNACTDFSLEHDLELQKHVVQVSLCFLRMKVDFNEKAPPNWVTQAREMKVNYQTMKNGCNIFLMAVK